MTSSQNGYGDDTYDTYVTHDTYDAKLCKAGVTPTLHARTGAIPERGRMIRGTSDTYDTYNSPQPPPVTPTHPTPTIQPTHRTETAIRWDPNAYDTSDAYDSNFQSCLCCQSTARESAWFNYVPAA